MATTKLQKKMKLFARSYREIKLDTTNTLWSDLADRCFEEFKKK
jgi:very-short-patch-repair endonuclease